MLFELRDVELFEERFPERLPAGRPDSGKATDNQEERYPASQRHFWKCRAVARLLWEMDRSLSASQIADSKEIALFGCEDWLDQHGKNVVTEWIADVCLASYRPTKNEVRHPSHPEHEDRFIRLPGDFDSEKCNVEEVNRRLRGTRR